MNLNQNKDGYDSQAGDRSTYYHTNIDSKRKSRDITTITDETALGSIKEQTTEVKATDNHKVKVTGQKSNEVIDSGASGEKEDEDPEKDKNQINESKTDSADSQT
ncbi:hypothetical protein MAR_008645, partial [Mya arenaria]